MKRRILLIALVLIFLAPLAFAEGYWGARIGINAGTFLGDDAAASDFGWDEKGSRAGFVGGAFLDYRFNEFLGIRPELMFSGKGAKYDISDTTDVKFKLRTIEVPILLEFFLPIPTDALDVAVFAGPAPALILKAEYEGSDPSGDEEGDMEDIGLETTDFDLGVAFGSAVSIPAGPGMVLIDFRYTLGVLSVIDVTPDLEIRTGTFGASVGYGFLF